VGRAALPARVFRQNRWVLSCSLRQKGLCPENHKLLAVMMPIKPSCSTSRITGEDARLLSERKIGALPAVEDGKLQIARRL